MCPTMSLRIAGSVPEILGLFSIQSYRSYLLAGVFVPYVYLQVYKVLNLIIREMQIKVFHKVYT